MAVTAEDKKILSEYMSKHRLMSVATYGDHPWVASVYYVSDENLDLYFFSSPESEHSIHIEKNPNVACAIADSTQMPADVKLGLQIFGEASVENAIPKLKWMFKMYGKLYPSTREKHNYKNFETKVLKSKLYKVEPKKIKFFNQELYKPPAKLFEL